MMAAADAAQALKGNRVRSTSGPQVTSDVSSKIAGPCGLPCLPFTLASQELVTAKAITAVRMSASSTRSNRPSRSRGCRGGGGLVTSADSSATIRRGAAGLIFQA
jgi:hypothetical protein